MADILSQPQCIKLMKPIADIAGMVLLSNWYLSFAWELFHKQFFLVIQIQCKLKFGFVIILRNWSLQVFTHNMIAVLLLHVQKIVVIS